MTEHLTVLLALVFITVLLLPLSALAASTVVALSTVSGSSLTDGATYSISTEAELAKLADLVNGGEDCKGNYFVLTADIALSVDHNGASAGKWVPIGSGTFSESSLTSTSGSAFNGSFYGQNHTISGLDSRVTSCSGLFGYIGSSGIVTDLSVSGAMTGASCAGGIAAINQGSILNCTNNANYSSSTPSTYSYIGGIVGANQGVVQSCRNNGSISGFRSGTSGDTHIGGVAGYCKDNAKVLNCVNTASVGGWSNIGGIVGDTSSEFPATIANCYNLGGISGYDACGGIVGVLNLGSRLLNCYTHGSISVTSATHSGSVAGDIGTSCTVDYCFWLDSTFTKGFGISSSMPTNSVVYISTFSLSTPVGGTSSLVTALNNYAVADTSLFLRSWSAGTRPEHLGTLAFTKPSDVTASVGDTAQFTALAVGSSVTYQWQVSTDGSTWNDVTTGIGGNTPTYSTPSITAAMNGYRYRCVFSGSVNSSYATLSLGAAPIITTQPVDAYAKLGDPIYIFLVATGSPAPTYSWQYSPDNVDWYPMYTSDSKVGTDAMVTILNGIYVRCVVYNSFGSAASNVAKFSLPIAPAVSTQPSDKTAVEGKTATFTAAATGGPTPDYQWQINRGSGWSNISGANKASYTTAAATLLNDGYLYRVVVTNIAGSATSDPAKLHVVESAVIPTTGDTAQPELWFGAGLFSLAGLSAIALLYFIRRNKRA